MRRLLAVLEAAGVTTVTAQPDAIGSATTFLACLSAGAGGVTRYAHEELRCALEHVRGRPAGIPWIVLAKVVPCTIPSLPGLPANASILDLHGEWSESVAWLIGAPPAPGSATFVLKADEYLVGGDATFTNLDHDGGTVPGGADARSEITIKTFVADGAVNFTNVRNRSR